MVRVVLMGNFRQLTGGESGFDVEASNIRQLFKVLGERYPGARPPS